LVFLLRKSIKKEIICRFCKKTFLVLPSSPKVYCSKKCYYDSRSSGYYKTKKICLQCGKEYKINSRIKTRKFCSRKCFHNWNKGRFIPWNKGLTKKDNEKLKEISKRLKGKDVGFGKDYHHSKEAKEKIGLSKIELYKDPSKTPNWRGGISFEPYGLDFNKKLKKMIFNRDKYFCQLCGKKLKTPQTHHIDYDKNHNHISNLITLCRSCHAKTGFNRETWVIILNNMLEINERIKAIC